MGDGRDYGEDPARDAVEAAQLYDLLETQVVPEFYARDENNIPRAWVARVRESMAALTPLYSANRCVREYVETAYLPAAASLPSASAEMALRSAVAISDWLRALERGWSGLRFGRVNVDTQGEWHHLAVPVALGDSESRPGARGSLR